MSLVIPAGLTLQSLEKDTVTLTVDATHSVARPHLIIIDRRVPTFNVGSSQYSQPKYRIRVVRGNLDSESLPVPARTLADLELQWVVGQSGANVEDDIIDPLLSILSLTGFAADVFERQLLPTEYPSA